MTGRERPFVIKARGKRHAGPNR